MFVLEGVIFPENPADGQELLPGGLLELLLRFPALPNLIDGTATCFGGIGAGDAFNGVGAISVHAHTRTHKNV